MTRTTARAVANAVLTAAAVGAAIVVLRTPGLRRRAWMLTKTAATTMLPAYLYREVLAAWAQSAGRTRNELPE